MRKWIILALISLVILSVLAGCGQGKSPDSLSEKRKEITISAVKNNKVYIISTDAKSIHSSVFHSYLARYFYPDRFKDLDPEAVYREWMQKFLGIEMKGIYAYPLP